MIKNEIIVNYFRYPEKVINLDRYKAEDLINTLLIKSNDNEIGENLENNDYYFISYQPSNNTFNITILIIKNINIDLSKTPIYFKSLKLLYLNNSNLLLSEKSKNFFNFEVLEKMKIKGDLSLIENNLAHFKDINILNLFNNITIKIISKSSSKLNIFILINSLSQYISQVKNSFDIYIKCLLSNLDLNKIEKPPKEILPKIKKICIFSLNKLNTNSSKIIKEELIDKLNNLEEFYLNENIECDLKDKLKIFNCINNNEDININYDLYDINKLNKISLPICEYNKTKNSLLLYGEANMSFYNTNNKKLLINLIKNNHKGNLSLLSVNNFDMENIDYLIELINTINYTDKLTISNLNINDEFNSIIKKKNLFNCECLTIDNTIFIEEETENDFYELINKYNNCKYLKLISIEDFGKYSDLILNKKLEKIYLEEIYDMKYELFKEIILKKENILNQITLNNLEISDDKDKNIISDIIIHCRSEIKKLKIIGGDFNFIYKEIHDKKIEFNKIEKLILHLDKEEENDNNKKDFVLTDYDKIHFLENNYKLINCNGIKKIDLGIFSLSYNDRKKLMNIFNNLCELY